MATREMVLDPSKEDEREPYFRRVLKRCRFSVGQHVRHTGTTTKGIVIDIIRDIKKVHWENNEAYFIIVKWHDKSQTMCYPAQLTTKKAR